MNKRYIVTVKVTIYETVMRSGIDEDDAAAKAEDYVSKQYEDSSVGTVEATEIEEEEHDMQDV